jgi:hypothetical protein
MGSFYCLIYGLALLDKVLLGPIFFGASQMNLKKLSGYYNG